MADAVAGSDAQQASSGASTDTGVSHKVDIGTDEAQASNVVSFAELCRMQSLKAMQDSHVITSQLFQNAVENANLIAKRTIAGFEIASDRQWNLDEVSNLARDIPFNLEALNALIVKAVGEAVSK